MAVVTIEACTPRSDDVFFLPAGLRLRGRVDTTQLKGLAPIDKNRLTEFLPGGIPGLQVTVDEAAGTATVFDPLEGTDDGEASEELKALDRYFLSSGKQPVKPVERAEHKLDAKGAQTWLHWMRRCVEGKTARLVEGAFRPDYPLAVKDHGSPPAVDPGQAQVDALIAQNAALVEQIKAMQADARKGR